MTATSVSAPKPSGEAIPQLQDESSEAANNTTTKDAKASEVSTRASETSARVVTPVGSATSTPPSTIRKTEAPMSSSLNVQKSPLELPASEPSSSAVPFDVKETIDGPLHERTPHLMSSAPVGVKTVQIPASDSASLGSVPSVLDSVGGQSSTDQRQQIQRRESGSASENSTLQQPLQAETPSGPPSSGANTQPFQQEGLVSQPPLLVALPFQQPTGCVMEQAAPEKLPPDGGQECQPGTQQTLLYQIPGVVSLPVEAPPHEQSQQEPSDNGQGQMQALPQSQEPAVGMVGTMPVVKLQGGGVHFVKKKKGRFNFLQETPAVSTTSRASGSNAATNPSPVAQPQSGTSAGGNGAESPSTAPPQTNSAGASSTIQPNGSTVPPAAPAATPQTFDGKSVPTIKKKGRFVVTNVKDPGSIQTAIQPQNQNPQSTPKESPSRQSSGQNLPNPHVQGGTNQPTANHNVHAQQQYPNQQGATQWAIPSTIDAQFFPSGQPLYAQSLGGQPALFTYSTPGMEQQAVFAQAQQTMGQPHNAPEMANQTHTMPQPLQQTNQLQNQQPPQQNDFSSDQNHVNIQSSSPSSTQASQGVGGDKESPGPNNQTDAAQNSVLPSVPKLPHTTDKPVGPSGARNRPTQKRPGKVPQSIDSNGKFSSVGVGRLSYLLDQIKSEVSDADVMIKSLQTDLKLMRDKNKQLEAKNRDLEQKVKEERLLRENTESRCIEFRRRLKEATEPDGQKLDKTFDETVDSTGRAQTNLLEVAASRDSTQGSKPPSAPSSSAAAANPSGNSKAGSGSNSLNPPSNPLGSNEDANVPKPAPAKPGAVPGAALRRASGAEQANPQVLPSKKNQSAVGGTSTNPSAPCPVKAISIATQGSASLQTQNDGAQQDESVAKKRNSEHGRTNSNGSGAEILSLHRVPTDGSMKSTDAQATPNSTKVMITQAGPSVPPVPQPRQQNQARPSGTYMTKAQRASDFDPLHPANTAQLSAGMVPVVSLPTSVSLEAMSITPSTQLFQNSNVQSYPSTEVPVATQFDQAAFVSDNPYVVPITFGMTQAVGHNSSSQQQHINGFQMQPPIMLQQPIMVHHGGVHQWAQPIVNGNTAQIPTYAAKQYPPQQPQQQNPQNQQHNPPSNPFDPLANRQ